MKILLANLLMIMIGSTGVFVLAQPKKQTTPPPAKVVVLEEDDPSAEFSEKGLPVPPILGENPSDKLAAKLAKDISKYDEKGLALLIATLQKAGFYIIDRNQKTLFQPTVTDDMGMAFYDFEVVGMYNASRMGMATTIKKFAELIAPGETQKETFPILILRDLTEAKNSPNRRVRFTANLIFELGKNFPTPVDLTTAAPEKATLNIIQVSLLERVLLGDLMSAYEKLTNENGMFNQQDLFKKNKFQFEKVGLLKKENDLCENLTDFNNVQKTERTLYRIADKIWTYKKMIEMGTAPIENVRVRDLVPYNLQYQDKIKFLQEFGQQIRIGNLVFSWVKLIMALNSVKIEFKVQDPLPLERVKTSRADGDVRTVTAKFRVDFLDKNKTDVLNCVGKAFQVATGIPFSIPKNESMADKSVSWELLTKGDKYQKFAEVPVFMSAPGKSDASKQKTDSNGESSVTLTGLRQSRDLTNEKVVPIIKPVELKASIALEKMDLDTDAGKLGKVLLEDMGMGLFLSTLELLPEMVGKMKLNSKTVRVPIQDWTPCSEDWGGFITYKRDLTRTEVIKSSRQANGNSSGDGIREITEHVEANIYLNPRKPEEMKTKPPNIPYIYVKARFLDVFTGVRDGDPCCGKNEGSFNTKFRRGTEETYSNSNFYRPDILKFTGNGNAKVDYDGKERDFTLSIAFSSGGIAGTRRKFYEVDQTTCALEEEEAKSEVFDDVADIVGTLQPGRYDYRFVNSEGELLQGEKETTLAPYKSKVLWTWSLARCQSNEN